MFSWAFNEMAAHIQNQQETLGILNLQFEQRVAERTAEIKKRKQIEEELREHLEKFIKISHLSILDGGEIMDHISEIQKLCQGFDSPYSERITQIEDAVFNGDNKQLNYLVQEAIEKLT